MISIRNELTSLNSHISLTELSRVYSENTTETQKNMGL